MLLSISSCLSILSTDMIHGIETFLIEYMHIVLFHVYNVNPFLQTKDFWREAQILSKLHHPNVVAFYGVVPDGTGGTLATVAEFMVNGSLRNVLLRKDR